MNKEIMKVVSFEKEVRAVENHKCPFCFHDINISRFRDKLSIKEYKQSGLCQDCQDKIFNSKNKELKN